MEFRRKKKQKSFARMLDVCPQKKGIVKRVRIQTPRKPNSARRKVAKEVGNCQTRDNDVSNRYFVARTGGNFHELQANA